MKMLPQKDAGVLKIIRTICVKVHLYGFFFNTSYNFSIRAYLYCLNDSIILNLIIITIIMKISLGVEAGLR